MRAKLRRWKTDVKGFARFSHNIMERLEKGKLLEEQIVIRKYLLGVLSDEVEVRRIEEQLLLDDEFAARLSIAEDELIEDYLDDNLTKQENAHFNNFFLNSPERREKLRLIRNLHKIAAKTKAETAKQVSEKKAGFFDWLFSTPALRFAVIILIVCGLGFGIWRIAFYKSDADVGLAELRRVFRSERPIQSRITGFDYAPFENIRGNKRNKIDLIELNRAERTLLDEAVADPTAKNLDAVGRLYLAKKEFDRAIQELEKAQKFAPSTAETLNDLGVAYLEKSKLVSGEASGKSLELKATALENFEKALEINPNLTEARFNKAVCLQMMNLPNQARAAWQEYLKFDADSPWAAEAKKNLESLPQEKSEDISAEELERKFLSAAQMRNDDQAFHLLNQNRELVREKYLPQRLAISYTQADNQKKDEILRALKYSGELEKRKTGDLFALELSNYYEKLSEREIDLLKPAQIAIQNGYKNCLEGNFSSAQYEFQTAKDLFDKAGDVWESRLAEHFIAYCIYNANHLDEGLALWSKNAEFCQRRNFKLLFVSNLQWIASAQFALEQYTESKKNLEKALALIEEYKDPYFLQRIFLALASQSHFFGENQKSLAYLNKILENDGDRISLRQKWRNFRELRDVLSASEFYYSAQAVANEIIYLADVINDPVFMVSSRIEAGSVNYKLKDFTESRNLLLEAQQKVSSVSEESTKDYLTAQVLLELANLERRTGNYESALQFYDSTLEADSKVGMRPFSYPAQKGKLFSYLALNNSEELDRQIPTTLEMAEKHRRQIMEEQWRNSFFDSEQTVYDVATEHEFNRGNYEKSYNYAEASNSRSLLDWLQKGVEVSYRANRNVDIFLKGTVEPWNLAEIRQQMPEQVQILQFTVLENRVLIWLITKSKFTATSVDIKSEDLRGKVKNYLQLIREKDDQEQIAADELYNLLIKPIENQLENGKKVCLIPSKILFHLPFAALRPTGDKPFLAGYEIFYAPSANVFLHSTQEGKTKTGISNESILSIGNPTFDREIYKDFPSLPEAEKEAVRAADLYDEVKTLVGNEATKKNFRKLASRYDVIHFAGHYIAKEGAPLSSSLLLAKDESETSDNILTNAELISKSLPKTKLVVLSACQTGVENYYNGEGLIGLSRTFLAAGVPIVVASQWKVDSGATAELMESFHRFRRQEKLSTSAALRRAQIEMLDSSDATYRQPYYWAAFAVFGGYAEY